MYLFKSILAVALLCGLLGFVVSGGLDTIERAERDSQRNERVKDFVRLGNRLLDGDQLYRLDRKYNDIATEVAEIPNSIRQKNWMGADGGSCVHATTITLLKWQGFFEAAEAWKR